MKEIDFDELDKAVSSLMAGAPKPPASSDSLEATNEAPAVSGVAAKPLAVPAAAQPVSSADSLVSTAPRVTPASRRGGRFMDVVPASQMKKAETTRPVSRQSAAIAPRPGLSGPDTNHSAAALVGGGRSVGQSDFPELSRPPVRPKSDWPDPLEIAESGSGGDQQSYGSEAFEPAVELKGSEIDSKKEPAGELPLTSPFLPDTKVEKRPLGSNASDESAREASTNYDDQLPATAEDVKPLLPEELHGDLVAIESDMTGQGQNSEQQAETGATARAEKPFSWNAPEEQKHREAVIPTGPVSIPQQYSEESSSGDQNNGSIYDTANYHQPLTHPAKQKSGWMWVIWILLILIIGAGSGAALYFLRIV